MNTSNLYKGQEVKNYRAMCYLVNEPVKTGKAKQLQVKDWQRYIRWTKDGNKFVIDEVFGTVEAKQTKLSMAQNCNRNVAKALLSDVYHHMNGYSDYIEEKYQNVHHENKMICSTNDLLKSYQLINDNTLLVKKQALAVANHYGIDYQAFQSNVNLDYTRAKDSLDRAFNLLKNVITKRDCYKLVMVYEQEVLNEDGEPEIMECESNFISTQVQYDFIKLSAYNNVLEEFGLSNMNDLYRKKSPQDVRKFYERVNEWIVDNCTNPKYTNNRTPQEVFELEELRYLKAHYHKISISYDSDFLEKRYIKDCLTSDDINMIQDKQLVDNVLKPQISKENMKLNSKNANSRHNNAKKKDLSKYKKNDSVYEQSNYIEVHDIVNDLNHNPNTKRLVAEYDIEQQWKRGSYNVGKMLSINNDLVRNKKCQQWIKESNSETEEFDSLWTTTVEQQPKKSFIVSDMQTIETDKPMFIKIDNSLEPNSEVIYDTDNNTMIMSESTYQAFMSIQGFLKAQGMSMFGQLNVNQGEIKQ